LIGRATRTERAMIVWGMSDVVITAIWIPVRWEAYLLITVPPLVLVLFVGAGVVIRHVRGRMVPAVAKGASPTLADAS
jgi:hypothetical protein